MSKTDFVPIFSLLPEEYQKQAILGRMEFMFANAEWNEIEKLLPAILNLQDQSQFKADVLLIGIKCALRLQKINLAFERYELLSDIINASNLADIQARALFLFASQILPHKSKKIFFYWLELINKQCTTVIARELKDVGKLLAENFIKNQDVKSYRYLHKIIKSRLENKDHISHRKCS